jgi:hypothetical protein
MRRKSQFAIILKKESTSGNNINNGIPQEAGVEDKGY